MLSTATTPSAESTFSAKQQREPPGQDGRDAVRFELTYPQ